MWVWSMLHEMLMKEGRGVRMGREGNGGRRGVRETEIRWWGGRGFGTSIFTSCNCSFRTTGSQCCTGDWLAPGCST